MIHRTVPGMLATCSVDKTITLWDTYNASETPTTGPPKACGNKDMNVGKLYTVNFYPSSPWLIGCAGNGKEIAIWDMTREEAVQKRFASRIGAEPVLEELEDTISSNHKEAFKAMMSAPEPTKTPTNDDSASKNRKKKGSGIKKNKAHKVRR
jgi:WD40 repeat protein